MQKRQPQSHIFHADRDSVSVADLRQHADGWLLACEINQHGPRTIERRRDIVHKLFWFLTQQRLRVCDVNALRAYFAYLNWGHKDPDGRWGNPKRPQDLKPMRPGTVHTLHNHLRAFFHRLVKEGIIDVSPMECIKPPIDRPDAVVCPNCGHSNDWRQEKQKNDMEMVISMWLLTGTAIVAGTVFGFFFAMLIDFFAVLIAIYLVASTTFNFKMHGVVKLILEAIGFAIGFQVGLHTRL